MFEKLRKNKYIFWFLASAIFFVFFLLIFEDIVLEKSVPTWDYSITSWLYTVRTPVLTDVMKGISYLGNVTSVLGFLALVSVLLIIFRKEKYIIPIGLSSLGGEIFVFFMKLAVQRERPSTLNALLIETDPSFPSGHSMVAVTVYALVFYFLIKAVSKKWQKIVLIIAGIMLVLGIGISRLYLGLHWPTDVLASYFLGCSWVCLILGIMKGWENIKRMIKR